MLTHIYSIYYIFVRLIYMFLLFRLCIVPSHSRAFGLTYHIPISIIFSKQLVALFIMIYLIFRFICYAIFLNHDFKSFCIPNDIKKVYQLYFMRLSTSQNDQRPPIAFLLVGIHAKSQQEVPIDAAFIIVLFHHYEQLLLSPIGIFCRLFLFFTKSIHNPKTFLV